jgi:hypothetical protein
MHQKVRNGWKENKFLRNKKNRRTVDFSLYRAYFWPSVQFSHLQLFSLSAFSVPRLLSQIYRNATDILHCHWAVRAVRHSFWLSFKPPFSIILGAFAKLWKATIRFAMSVCPHGTSQLPLDGFPWDLIFEYFPKICPENSSFIEIGKE